MTPHVSILIPAYNKPQHLRNVLNSIVSQTYKDYNVIVTDDTKNDNNLKIARDFYDHIPLTYYKNKVRLGSPANWNKALEIAGGDYIKFLHHDDWFTSSDSLQAFVDALDNNPNVNFAFSCSNACDINHDSLWTHCPTQDNLNNLKKSRISLLSNNFIGAPSATIFRNTSLQFDTHLKWLVDVDFYIRILNQNPKFIFIQKELVNITVGEKDSVTSECRGMRRVFERIYLHSKMLGA